MLCCVVHALGGGGAAGPAPIAPIHREGSLSPQVEEIRTEPRAAVWNS
jgi:hypothetical protein